MISILRCCLRPRKVRFLVKIDKRNKLIKESVFSDIRKLIEKEGEDKPSQELKECMMCYVNEPNTIFQPCGHGGICFDCSIEIMKNGNIECHYCRGQIARVLKIDTSKNYEGLFKVIDSYKVEVLSDSEESNSQAGNSPPSSQRIQ
jgi:hypothetical protein